MTLEELKELCEAAAPGPWTTASDEDVEDCIGPHAFLFGPETLDTEGYYYSPERYRVEDAKFIAAAREYMPKLIAVAKAARELSEFVEAEGAISWLTSYLANGVSPGPVVTNVVDAYKRHLDEALFELEKQPAEVRS